MIEANGVGKPVRPGFSRHLYDLKVAVHLRTPLMLEGISELLTAAGCRVHPWPSDPRQVSVVVSDELLSVGSAALILVGDSRPSRRSSDKEVNLAALVPTTITPTQLLSVVECVSGGLVVTSADLLPPNWGQIESVAVELSFVDKQALICLAQGHTTERIAEDVYMSSPRTAYRRLADLFGRLAVESREEAAALAIRIGLC